MADEWRLVGLEDDHCVATWKNIGVSIWRRAMTRKGLELSVRAYSEMFRARIEGVGWMVIVEPTSMPPDEEVRKLVLEAMEKMAGMKALAAVHEGVGFQNAATRAVAASLSATGKLPFPRRVFPILEEAARWLCIELSMRGTSTVNAEELCQVVRQVRGKMNPSPSQRPPKLDASPGSRRSGH